MHSDRITRLLAEMTPSEKLGQLQIVFRPALEDAAALVREGLGSVFWPRSAAAVNELQRVAVEESRLGIPVSTTHVISSSILGVGATRSLSAVRWGIAGRIVTAWVVTLPACIILAFVVYTILRAITGHN